MEEGKRKKILITGGAGFLGSHLCEKLLSLGHEVICSDNFHTGAKENISHLQGDHFQVLHHDICHPLYLDVDEIYNLACPASPLHYQADPIKTMKTSVFGALHVLGLAKRLNAKVLQASTSEVYGDPTVHPQNELYWGNVNAIGPRSCYDEGKRCAESLFFDYQRKHGVRIKVVRIFNTYGPRMHIQDGRVVSNLIVQALQGKPLTIYGDGRQTRAFCYVDDLIEGIYRMMEAPETLAGPINLGNPHEFTILELAEKILALTNSSSSIVFETLPQDDPKQRKPDISSAEKHLGWKPEVSLNEGLKKTIAYFDSLLSAAVVRE